MKNQEFESIFFYIVIGLVFIVLILIITALVSSALGYNEFSNSMASFISEKIW